MHNHSCTILVVKTPLDTVRALFRALEAGQTGDALAVHFDPEARQLEYPSLIGPQVRERGLADILAASVAGAGLLVDQRYDEVEALEIGNRAIVRLTWSATVSRDLAQFTAGQRLSSHVALFATVRDGRVLHQASYDCYEPFS